MSDIVALEPMMAVGNAINFQNFASVYSTGIQLELAGRMDIDKFIATGSLALRQNPDLGECSVESVSGGIIAAAQDGLSLDKNSNQAYLIPRFNKSKQVLEAVYQQGVYGLVLLAHRTELVKIVNHGTIREHDVFPQYEHGEKIFFRFATDEMKSIKERGKSVAYFATVTLVNGGFRYSIISYDDAQIHRAKYAPKSKVWPKHPDKMSEIIVIKRVLDTIPKANNFREGVFVLNEKGLNDEGYEEEEPQLNPLDALPKNINSQVQRSDIVNDEPKQKNTGYKDPKFVREANIALTKYRDKGGSEDIAEKIEVNIFNHDDQCRSQEHKNILIKKIKQRTGEIK